MHHSRRLLVVPVAVVALALTACGSEDASSDAPAAGEQADSNFNDADVVFAQSMIPHHEQAVDMAELALAADAAASAEIVALATAIQGAQGPEIVLMRSLLDSWGQPAEMSGMEGMEGMGSDEMDGMDHGGMEGMMSVEEMAALVTLTGADFDRAWAEMMIRHHEGAIAMAQTVLDSGTNPDVDLLADQVISAQQAEIEQMRALLAG